MSDRYGRNTRSVLFSWAPQAGGAKRTVGPLVLGVVMALAVGCSGEDAAEVDGDAGALTDSGPVDAMDAPTDVTQGQPDSAPETGPPDASNDSGTPDSGLDAARADADASTPEPTCETPGIGAPVGRFVDSKTLAYKYGEDDSKEQVYSFDRRVSASSLQEIRDYAKSGDDILIVVEGGHYQFGPDTIETLAVYNANQTLGIVAKEGARVTWSPPAGMTTQWMRFNTKHMVLDNIDFDFDIPVDVAPVVKFTVQTSFVLADVDVIGRAWHRSKKDGSPGVLAEVDAADGVGIIRNYNNPRVSGRQTHFGHDGRWGFRAGPKNFGTLEFIDCVVKEASAYGIYSSGSNGRVNIRGGVWANNAGYNVRVPNGSTIEDAYIYHDWQRYGGPEDPENVILGTGIFAETKYVDAIDGRTGVDGEPIIVRNSRIELGEWPKGYRAGILVNSNHGELQVINTDIVVNHDDPKAAIWAAPPDGSTIWTDPDPNSQFYHLPVGPVRTYVENSRLTGNADIPAIFSEEREGSVVKNSLIEGYAVGVRSTVEQLDVESTDIRAAEPTKGNVNWISQGAGADIGSTICAPGTQ